MEIKIGQTYMNKTYKYLRPALKLYGSTFVAKFNSFNKLAYGVHDTLLDGTPIQLQRTVFVLLDKFVKPAIFNNIMDWMRHQEYYITDYPFDGLDGRQHILVLEFPEKYGDIYDKFLEGKYSEMYCFDEVESFFPNDTAEAKHVVIKSRKARAEFIVKVNQEYGSAITDFEKGQKVEYDFPLRKKEEYFNFN